MHTPVLLVAFNRPEETRRVLSRILEQCPRRLYVAVDGPRSDRMDSDLRNIRQVRNLVMDAAGETDLRVRFLDENHGCRVSVSSAITWALSQEEELIILEDDCLPSDSFFSFCEAMLAEYRRCDEISMVSGTQFFSDLLMAEGTHYRSKVGNAWGWATWRRAWAGYSAGHLMLSSEALRWAGGRLPFFVHYWRSVFQRVELGELDSWAYVWGASNWAQARKSIVPVKNLVTNIGFTGDASHTKKRSFGNFSQVPLSVVSGPFIEVGETRGIRLLEVLHFVAVSGMYGRAIRSLIRAALGIIRFLTISFSKLKRPIEGFTESSN